MIPILLCALLQTPDDLADQIARLERKMIDVSRRLETSDPDKSERLQRGLRLLRERAAALHAQQLREQAARGNDGNARRHRESVIETLRRLLALLEGRLPSDEPTHRPADEVIADLRAALKRVLDEQIALNVEVKAFDAAREAALSREGRQRARELAAAQERIASDIEDLRRRVAEVNAAVFAFALERARDEADDARERLHGARTGAPTQAVQESIVRRLKQLLEAFEEVASESPPGGEGPPGDRTRERLPGLAELKLIAAMQADLYRRTLAADRALPPEGAEPGAAHQALLRRLSDEQGALARLLKGVMEKIRFE